MHDLSFVIPIRVDTPDRLENCETILRFLLKHFPEAEIQLIEEDTQTKTASLRQSFPTVVWHFKFNDKHFSRGAALNTGFLRSTRRCVCAYDTDILLDPSAVRKAVSLIRSGRWSIVIPFNLIFVELSGERRKSVIESLDIGGLSGIAKLSDVPKHPEIAARVLSGAIMLCDRDIAVMEGGYNRKMVSYGWEDIEFFKRFEKLGYFSFMLSNFNLIHLDHRRGPDSRINEMYEINRAEFEKIMKMSKAELRRYAAEELQIEPGVDLDRRRRIQKRQLLRNWLTLRPVVHAMNKAATIYRVRGPAVIVDSLRRKSQSNKQSAVVTNSR